MAQHKDAQTGLVATTSVSIEDVIRIGKAVAETQEPDYFRGHSRIEVSDYGSEVLELVVKGGVAYKFKHLTFTVIAADHEGATLVRTHMGWYLTTQSKLWGIVPIGPKTLVGLKTYKLFLERLASTLQDADPTSNIVISATADSTRPPTRTGRPVGLNPAAES